ncbi:hypothetical protein [Enemella sp. A6]|uniref:GAP1-N2 domain-containing protein n=1 Tax=Enemella sp. A6 TaxID=3440152 RepID=UPI003EBFBBCF
MTRYGQLTYTSFDARNGLPGGWQVKQTIGGLNPDEVQYLSARVATQLDAGAELPRFPTPEQIAALPRRMRHAGAGALAPGTITWHTAPAGFDASGRPGNVFAHVLLDRDGTPAGVRPILTWRSPDWLTPYGAEQVLAAELQRPEPPRPGVLTPEAVADLLFAPRTGHLAVLQVLLDATMAALEGGPMVVLGVSDLEQAATWIAAVQLMMAPGTAARHGFSTLERADTLTDARVLGLHLVAVPVADLDALERTKNLVVLDAGEPVEVGDLDGAPHRTDRGDAVRVTPWSVMVAEVLEDADAFVRVTEAIDRACTGIDDGTLHPAWPLAKLVADGWDLDVLTEAHRVLEWYSPAGFVDESDLRSRTGRALRRAAGGDLERAWAAATADGATTLDAEVYADLAFCDDAWLTAPGPTRIPPATGSKPAPEMADTTAEAAQRVMRLDTDPVTRLSAGLHVLELALAVGAGWHDKANQALVRLCTDLLLPGLLSDDAAGLLAAVQYTITDPARTWLWTLLDRSETPVEGINPDVVEWLAPRPELGEPDPLPTASPFDDPDHRPSALTVELIRSRLRHGQATPEQVAWLVVTDLDRHPKASPGYLPDTVADWPLPWVQELVVRYPHLPADGFTAVAVRHDDPRLWQALAERRDGKVARSRLRLADAAWVTGTDPDEVVRMLGRLLEAVPELPPGTVHPMRNDAGRALAIAVLARRPVDPAWFTRIGAVRIRGFEAVNRWAEPRLPEAVLLWWLLHGQPDLDLPHSAEARWLHGVEVADAETGEASLIEAIMVRRWQQEPRTPQQYAEHLLSEADQAGARLDRRTDRWLRAWAQQRHRKEGSDAHVRT